MTRRPHEVWPIHIWYMIYIYIHTYVYIYILLCVIWPQLANTCISILVNLKQRRRDFPDGHRMAIGENARLCGRAGAVSWQMWETWTVEKHFCFQQQNWLFGCWKMVVWPFNLQPVHQRGKCETTRVLKSRKGLVCLTGRDMSGTGVHKPEIEWRCDGLHKWDRHPTRSSSLKFHWLVLVVASWIQRGKPPTHI